MSEYRVIWPEDALDSESDADGEPFVVQFHLPAVRPSLLKMDIVARARLLFDNRSCRGCGYPVVTPIELNDGLVNRNRRPIPGTATLVGFHCDGCGEEWSV